MLPKTHIILGAIFTIVLYFSYTRNIFALVIIFLSTFLFDVDHYLFYVNKKKDYSLKNAFNFYINLGKFHKPVMNIFHTLEFILLLGLLGYINDIFFFAVIGLVFHSILDILYLNYEHRLFVREFSLIRYLILKKRYPNKYL